MDEKPESIWKKSWTGWRGLLLGWLVLMVATLIIFLVVMLAAGARITSEGFKLWAVLALGSTILILVVLFLRWIFCWRNFKRILFGLACLATLIALFYAEEDWRGKHDWEKFKREWEAKGEHFDLASVIPPPVPDDQNFAMAPVFDATDKLANRKWRKAHQNQHGSGWDTNLIDPLQIEIGGDNYNDWPADGGNWQLAKLADLKEWQNYYRTLAAKTNEFPIASQPQSPAQDILLALSKYDSTVEALRQASQLPYSRFPLDYDDEDPAEILLPHLADLKRCSQMLRLRALAELENGQNEKAFADVKLSLRLIDSVRSEPFLISQLVRIAILQITFQPIYEGLANHRWTDAQLADLDSELVNLDFLSDYEFDMRGERALGIGIIEFLQHPPRNPDFQRPRFYFMMPILSLIQELSNLTDDDGENTRTEFQTWALVFGPSGWLDQNNVRIAQFETKWYLPVVDQKTRMVLPAKVHDAEAAYGQEMLHSTPENELEIMLLPALASCSKKFAYAQTSVDLARVAIALERYRLAHGEFPGSLDALAPQFLEKIPHDVIGGQPLHYRRTDDGQFVLYSVGWNGKDDGGVVEPRVIGVSDRVNRNPIWDYSQGDWVWRYPSKEQ